MLGILLIDKPLGCSSHDVVNIIRRRLGTKRVGHAGTLDPLGTGLLVVAVGPATRFLQYLPLEPKQYEGTITFGRRTTTYDAEGETVSEGPAPADLAGQLEALKPRFLGLIEQIPPMHSAVKVGGKPLYKYARKGEEIERQTRTIHISSLDFGPLDGPNVDFRLVCSGGTYVRTLADDLGQALGCGAFLSRLRRSNVGRFSLDDACSLDDVSESRLMPLRHALEPMEIIGLTSRQTEAIREGQQVTIQAPGEDVAAQIGQIEPMGPIGPILSQPPQPSGPTAQRSTLNASSASTPQRLNSSSDPTAQGSTPNAFRLVALADPSGDVFSVARLIGNLVQPECVIPSEALDGSL